MDMRVALYARYSNDNQSVASIAYCLREKCSRTPVCCLIINAPGRRGFSLTLSVRFPRSKPLATRAFHCAVASERLASQWPFTRVPVR
jgi:hypothetical protein